MSKKEKDRDPGAPPEPPSSTEPPETDTSTDWDEWMEKHRGRPRPSPDVADAEGKFTRAWIPRVIGAVAFLMWSPQNAAAQAVINVSDTVNIKFGMLVQTQADWTQDAATRGYQQNLFIRRVRFLVGGQVAPNVTVGGRQGHRVHGQGISGQEPPGVPRRRFPGGAGRALPQLLPVIGPGRALVLPPGTQVNVKAGYGRINPKTGRSTNLFTVQLQVFYF